MDPYFDQARAAIAAGDTQRLGELVDDDPSLATRRSSCGHPSLLQSIAVDYRQGTFPRGVESIDLLLQHGAHVFADEALIAAASTDSRLIVDALIDRGATLNQGTWGPIDEALYWAHTELAHHLVQRGANISSLRVAAGLGNMTELARFFTSTRLRDCAGPIGSPFPDTLDEQSAKDPQSILDHALIIATLNKQLAVIRALVDRGADPNNCPTGFHWGGNALHAAIWRYDERVLSLLLELGADPTVTDNAYGGDGPGWAKHHGHDDLAKRLASLSPSEVQG